MTILESFDSLSGTGPWTGSIRWTETGTGDSVALSTSHVTQGTHSWNITNAGTNSGIGHGSLVGDAALDISAYSKLSVDVYVATIPTNGQVRFALYDSTGAKSVTAIQQGITATQTTLSIDLTTVPFSLTNVSIILGCNGQAGTVSIFWDNLVASVAAGGAGSTPIMRSAIIQGLGAI